MMKGACDASELVNNAKATQPNSPSPINEHHHPNNQTPPSSKFKNANLFINNDERRL